MFELPKDRPAIMGVLNVTPDSFSDGGEFFSFDAAIGHARQMVHEGADLIDVGGESTRPGAEPVPLDEELRRTLHVVQLLVEEGVPVSVDTCKPQVAREAIRLGASVINDVTGFRDPAMIEASVDSNCSVCIMHMQGEPRTMQANPNYVDVVSEVCEYLIDQATVLESQGIQKERIWIDPGIGFGKTVHQNLLLLKNLDTFVETGYPVLLGVSRKSFIGRLLGSEAQPLPSNERVAGTLATQVIAQLAGVKILRVHDVRVAKEAMKMVRAITLA